MSYGTGQMKYHKNECTKSANPRCLHGHCWPACIMSELQQAAAVSGYYSEMKLTEKY